MPRLTVDAKLADQLRDLGSKNGVVEFVDESGCLFGVAKATSNESKYRPLPAFGSPEFYAEIERRHRNPGRTMTIEESMADWD